MHFGQNTGGEVVVINAARSLMRQLSRTVQRRWGLSVRMVTSRRPAIMATAMENANSMIIDATINPKATIEVLEQAVNLVGPEKVAVYTEVLHEGLELSVRRVGVLLLFGPLSQPEWRGVFEPRLHSELAQLHHTHAPQHRRPIGLLRNFGPAQWRKQPGSTGSTKGTNT